MSCFGMLRFFFFFYDFHQILHILKQSYRLTLEFFSISPLITIYRFRAFQIIPKIYSSEI